MKSLSGSLIGIIVICLIWGCANEIVLTGGDRDTDPPQLDTVVSTPNFQLRFFPTEIFLEFDEFVNLRNPSKNIGISPPLVNAMDVQHRGKKITIAFDENEKLKDNATYIINFGESISDYTEGNKLSNFSYVFSTGDFIDSLSLKGRVIDAYTKEPVKDITVMLYDDIADSVVYTQKPFYYTSTDKEGKYEFQNLRGDTFKLVALNDLNLNFLYEKNAELFAYAAEPVIIDTNQLDIELLAFQAEAPARYESGKMTHDGLATLQFDQELDSIPLSLITDVEHYMEYRYRNVLTYVRDIDLYPLKFEIRADTLIDTISIRKPQSKDRQFLPDFKLKRTNINDEYGLHPQDTLILEYGFPLDSLSYEILNMSVDEIFIDTANRKLLKVIDTWEEGGDYNLKLDSSAVWDFYGRTMDSIGLDFEIGRVNLYGSMSIDFSNLEDSMSYIISILDGDEKEIQKFQISGNPETETLENLIPGEYAYKIIKDQNGDGRWNTGNYDLKQQPEKIADGTLQAIESNRINEETIDLIDIFSKVDSVDNSIIITEEEE